MDRVVHLDFARARDREQSGETPPEGAPSHGTAGPEPATLAAVAHLIAERAAAGALEDDIDTICRLLHQRCAWSSESLARLRRAAALARSLRSGTAEGGSSAEGRRVRGARRAVASRSRD